jgi:hypothetical protein
MSLAKSTPFVLPYEPAAIGLRETERARDFKRMLQQYQFRRLPSAEEPTEQKKSRLAGAIGQRLLAARAIAQGLR